MFNKNTLLGLVLIASLLLTSCYRVPVPQGNSLSARSIHKITRGMTSTQVIRLLGTPVINNAFVNDQLVYVYSYKSQLSPLRIKRVFIYFEHDHVVRVTSSENVVN